MTALFGYLHKIVKTVQDRGHPDALNCQIQSDRAVQSQGRRDQSSNDSESWANLVDVWQSGLKDQKQAHSQLMSEIENDFLAIGKSMRDLSKQSKELRLVCEKVMALTCGQKESSAVEFSFQLLKKSEDLVLASYEQFEHVFAFFGETRHRLVEISKRQQELLRVLRILPIITIQIRVLSSKYDDKTRDFFFALSFEIEAMKERTWLAIEKQFGQIAEAECASSLLLSKLSEIVVIHKREVTGHLKECRRNLFALNDAMQSSGALVEKLGEETGLISQLTSRVVVALQCQDRARQKIEHVGAAIDEMRLHLNGSMAAGMNKQTFGQAKQYLTGSSHIQLKQIESVMNELKDAGTRILSGIDQIASSTAQISQGAQCAAATTLNADMVNQSTESIAKIFSIIEVTLEQIQQIKGVVEPLKVMFTNSTSEIRMFALEIHRISLNTEIHGINLSQDNAIAALSRNVVEVSRQVVDVVSGISGEIEGLQDMLLNLSDRLSDFDLLVRHEKTSLSDESILSRNGLTEANGQLKEHLASIAPLQNQIIAIHRNALDRLKFPERVETTSERTLTFFYQLIDWCQPSEPNATITKEVTKLVDKLKKNYTMEHELVTHNQAIGGKLAEKPPQKDLQAKSQSANVEVEPFGEIELFDGGGSTESSDSNAANGGTEFPAIDSLLSEPKALQATGPKQEQNAPKAEFGTNVELF